MCLGTEAAMRRFTSRTTATQCTLWRLAALNTAGTSPAAKRVLEAVLDVFWVFPADLKAEHRR